MDPKLKKWLTLARPFTLLPPLLGIISGAVCAWGSVHNPDPARAVTWSVLFTVALGSITASLLNAANNALNQIYDLEIDRVNKGKRPLPSGRLSIAQAWWFVRLTYALTLWLAWMVAPLGRHECFWIVVVAIIATYIYSVPPLRTKQRGWWANITIAVPRGVLLKV
ncbi:MAG: UbiA family prenyltransferase, partial [Thermoanaerobaculia bacterium]